MSVETKGPTALTFNGCIPLLTAVRSQDQSLLYKTYSRSLVYVVVSFDVIMTVCNVNVMRFI